MFEFHGWARVQSSSGRTVFDPTGLYEPDDEGLMDLLRAKVNEMEPASRECMHIQTTVNGYRTLIVAGLRNHRDPAVVDLFRWLGENRATTRRLVMMGARDNLPLAHDGQAWLDFLHWHRFEYLTREGRTPACPSCQSAELEKQLSVFAVSVNGAPRAASTPAFGACGTCGDPRGPASCSMN